MTAKRLSTRGIEGMAPLGHVRGACTSPLASLGGLPTASAFGDSLFKVRFTCRCDALMPVQQQCLASLHRLEVLTSPLVQVAISVPTIPDTQHLCSRRSSAMSNPYSPSLLQCVGCTAMGPAPDTSRLTLVMAVLAAVGSAVGQGPAAAQLGQLR